MFVSIREGDRVYIPSAQLAGKVVDTSRTSVQVELDDGEVMNTHKSAVVKLTDKLNIIKNEGVTQVGTPQDKIKEFHKAFNYTRNEAPTVLTADEVFKRITFIQEELVELLAASTNTTAEFSEYMVKLGEKNNEAYLKEVDKVGEKEEKQRIVEQSDALVDILYFTYGTGDMSGVQLDPLFDIVHKANMGKLDENGRPIYNEFGKIQKSDLYIPPEPALYKEIIKQIEESDINGK